VHIFEYARSKRHSCGRSGLAGVDYLILM
jgi:hypothetical protein